LNSAGGNAIGSHAKSSRQQRQLPSTSQTQSRDGRAWHNDVAILLFGAHERLSPIEAQLICCRACELRTLFVSEFSLKTNLPRRECIHIQMNSEDQLGPAGSSLVPLYHPAPPKRFAAASRMEKLEEYCGAA
jgi:hypothetical protein